MIVRRLPVDVDEVVNRRVRSGVRLRRTEISRPRANRRLRDLRESRRAGGVQTGTLELRAQRRTPGGLGVGGRGGAAEQRLGCDEER